MYVAMSQGFFEENGIEIDLQTGQAPWTQLQIGINWCNHD
jgi:ABC-type nitrate/sulfonate/bicarbonate transport system substrate-binding protein